MDVAPASWILVVEDDANAREGLIALLTTEGFLARGARNGQEALDLLDSESVPSLILLDLTLPRVTGWELLTYTHGEPALRLIPVIVMTASTEHGGVVADEVLTKPIDVARLLRSVRRLIGAVRDDGS